jgi:hypothetical protein
MEEEEEGRTVLIGTVLVVVVIVLGVASLGAVWGVARFVAATDTTSSQASGAELSTASPAREAAVMLAPSPTFAMVLPTAAPLLTSTTVPATTEPAPTPTMFPTEPPAPPSQTTKATALLPAPPAPSATSIPVIVEPSPTSTTSQARTSQPTDVIVSDTFDDPSSGWPVRERETWSALYVDGRYEMTLSGQPSSGSSTAFAGEHYRWSATIAVFQGQAGLIFLSTPPAKFYRLLISPDGTYSVESITQGNDNPTVLLAPTAHRALRRGAGVSNRMTVERHENTIQFFVNDQLLTHFLIPSGEYINHYGFAIASPSGQARATFDTIFGERLSG